MFGVTDCRVRNNLGANAGVTNCLTPGGGETRLSQCVNTVLNDTVRSGNPILSTKETYAGLSPADQTTNLIRDFLINVSVGTVGHQSERGLASLVQLLSDNETDDTTKFFRKDSLRGIIFVTDEDDQSFDTTLVKSTLYPGIPTPTLSPANDGYNTGACATKTVDGHTFQLAKCVVAPSLLMTPASVKTSLDTFFDTLDEGATTDVGRNYFITTITPLTAASIQTLQAARDAGGATTNTNISNFMSANPGTHHTATIAATAVAVDRGDRYLELGNLVGNGSLSLDLAESDFSPILTAIGNNIIDKKSTFKLRREPTGSEEMIVSILNPDGTTEVIPDTKYTITGIYLKVTDEDLILNLNGDAKISINYQPRFVED
jgi:hypothetical protein